MSWMFFECKSLSSLSNISKWNTKNITNTGGMFNGCEFSIYSKLKEKNIP